MSWNYRVRCEHDGEELVYDLIECYYNDANEIIGWCHAGPVIGENLYDLHGILQRLLFVTTAAIVTPGSDPLRGLITADMLPADVEGLRFDEEGEPLADLIHCPNHDLREGPHHQPDCCYYDEDE